MRILIVDDSSAVRSAIQRTLHRAGYTDLVFAASARETFHRLGLADAGIDSSHTVDLILLDIILPDLDGREICRIVKSVETLRDIPIIMVTALSETEHLEMAFAAGAMDYITKPVNDIELLVRVRSALKLKREMDERKLREQHLLELTSQLEEAVAKLNRLSSLDGLTGIANRRRFDEYLSTEWRRSQRNASSLALIMIDIDCFKAYNDHYGHQAGDECLKTVAAALSGLLKRPGDLLCRYGGEEFAVILPEVHQEGALALAKTMGASIEALCLEHHYSEVSPYVTISSGVVCTAPDRFASCADLLRSADKALYQAKHSGKNNARLAALT